MNEYPMLRDAKIYVSTRKKAEQTEHGKPDDPKLWLRVADYRSLDEFTEACKELHDDEEKPEFVFLYNKDVPRELCHYDKVHPVLFELCAASKEINGDKEKEAFFRWCDNATLKDLTDTSMSIADKFLACYVGMFDSDEDFAAAVLDTTEYLLPEFTKKYFDYSKYANDLLATDYYRSGMYYYQYY